MHTTDAELVYIDDALHLVCLNAETNTSHVLLDNWSLVRQNKRKIFLDKQKYFFELQELRYTCHCCNHFILMCSFHFAGPVQPRPGPAWGCCCISAPDLHFTNIGPAIIRDKPRVNSKLYPGNSMQVREDFTITEKAPKTHTSSFTFKTLLKLGRQCKGHKQ